MDRAGMAAPSQGRYQVLCFRSYPEFVIQPLEWAEERSVFRCVSLSRKLLLKWVEEAVPDQGKAAALLPKVQ